MKKIAIILLLSTVVAGTSIAQQTKFYGSTSLEMIFSFADIDNQGYDQGNVMRWAPVINPQTMFNADFGNVFGMFTGLAIRNVGFIYDNPLDGNKYKYRTYNAGIPAGFKLGKLDKFFVFGGYEIEFPFVYKEKRFVDEVKDDKFTVWFSDRVVPVQHSLLAGIQFPYGMAIKFKYYLTNFHNRDFMATGANGDLKPYDFKSNIFYFSLSFYPFKNWKTYEPKNVTKIDLR